MARLQTNTINQSEPSSDSTLAGETGARHNKERMVAAYPGSPLWEDRYSPVLAFEELVLEADLSKETALASGAPAYWGFDTISRGYGVNGAPDVGAEVTQASGYGVGGPFTPQVASVPGADYTQYSNVTPVDPVANKTTKAPFRGPSCDAEGNSVAQNSQKIREHTHSLFDSATSGITRMNSAMLGSNTDVMPHTDPVAE